MTGLGTPAASFQYDAFGRRIGKTIGTTTTAYVYDGSNFVQEKSDATSTATVTANLITGGLDELFARMTPSTGVTTLLTDALGSTVSETSSTQAVTMSYSYTPYGNTTSNGTVPTGNSQHFTGREEDDTTALYYYRARYYSPITGRFIQEDPIGWASGQANDYSYVGGNPISNVDPLGLAACGCQSIGQNFMQNFKDDWNTTNHFFFSFPTSLSRTALSVALSSANVVADATGGATLVQAVMSLPSGGIPLYGGIGGTLLAGGVGFLSNSLIVTGSLETGITTGSLLNASVQTLLDQLSCY